MKIFPKFWQNFTPIQSLVIGFALIILTGTILLTLPIASSNGISQPFIDALFVGTSGISTTGLTPVDIGKFYTLFGQLVVLALVQIGGLGYMVFILFIAYIIGHKPSLYTRVAFHESLAGISLGDMKRMTRSVIFFTFFFEFIGTVIYSLHWIKQFPIEHAIYLGVFHSISGFCTAGFGLFSDNMMSIRDNTALCINTNIICLAGAIGFFVLYDLYNSIRKTIKGKRPLNLSLHSKLAIVVTAAVIVVGCIIVYLSEKWPSSLSIGQKLLISSFQPISASTTTGYNSIDIGAMQSSSLFILICLMFIGASPGGTGGGIKTTTFGILIITLKTLLKGDKDVTFYKRRVPSEVVNKAFEIGLIAIMLVIVDLVIMTFTEKATFLQIFFEIVSGFGNVGLSTGITPNLTNVGKLVIIVTMFIGRVGPLAIGFSMIGKPRKSAYRYQQEAVFVG